MQLKLRGYQLQSVYALNRAINADKHPLCVLPTGSGKSLVIAGLLLQRDERALVVSHNAELLEQDAKILRSYAPGISQSFFAAKLKQKNAGAQVVFASVQSASRSLDRFKSRRSLLLIDEPHLCPRDQDSMYAKVFDYFGAAKRAGFTATPLRLDSGSLIEGDDRWFDCIAHEVSKRELIEAGYLLPLTGIIAEQQANLDGVHSRGGEYVESEAQQAVMRTLSLEAAVQQACMLAVKRKSWLVFAVGIEHAQLTVDEFRRQGIDTELVIGNTATDQRSNHIDRFKKRELRCLVNVGVLTTGFDAPFLDCIISMRPTQSPILWEQMLGRGMRTAEGKKDCLLLDFVGNLERLGGVDAVTEIQDKRLPADLQVAAEKRTKLGKRKRAPPEFFDASGRDPMLSGDLFDARVTAVRYFTVPSRKQPGKTIVVASYILEDEFGRALTANTFLCVEYAGGARYLATRWFKARGVIDSDVPTEARTGIALARVLPQPEEVSARYDARMRCYVVERERFALSE